MDAVLAVRIKDVAGDVGVGGLLHGQSVAPIPFQGIADDTSRRRTDDLDAIVLVVLDNVRRWFVIRPQDSDVRRRAPKHENAVLTIASDGAVDDAAEAVLRDFDTTVGGPLDGVVVDRGSGPTVHGNPEEATRDGETFDGHFAAEDLDSGLTCIGRDDRGLALTIDGDPADLGGDEDVLSTTALHEQHVSWFETTERRPNRTACIAVDR